MDHHVLPSAPACPVTQTHLLPQLVTDPHPREGGVAPVLHVYVVSVNGDRPGYVWAALRCTDDHTLWNFPLVSQNLAASG